MAFFFGAYLIRENRSTPPEMDEASSTSAPLTAMTPSTILTLFAEIDDVGHTPVPGKY